MHTSITRAGNLEWKPCRPVRTPLLKIPSTGWDGNDPPALPPLRTVSQARAWRVGTQTLKSRYSQRRLMLPYMTNLATWRTLKKVLQASSG